MLAAAALLFVAAQPALAVEPDEILADSALEARARDISGGLRCLVCQNQSIDDSNAPLARDLRLLVRERLKAGDSDSETREFVVARYGEFVLLRPPFAWRTLILWGAPFLALLAAGYMIWLGLSRRQPVDTPQALSPEEERELEELLDGAGDAVLDGRLAAGRGGRSGSGERSAGDGGSG